jgi:hypothetical protein
MTNTNCLEGIKCPACGNEDHFLIGARVVADVTDDGADIASPMHCSGFEWHDASYARCPECDKEGTLKDFKVRDAREPNEADAVGTASVQYTPGPWEIRGDRDDADGLFIVQQATGGLICWLKTTPSRSPADTANARLIAAAPAQTIILSLVQLGLMTLEPGEAEFDGVMYWFDERQPDWCAGVVNAIGWDKALAAIAEPATDDEWEPV